MPLLKNDSYKKVQSFKTSDGKHFEHEFEAKIHAIKIGCMGRLQEVLDKDGCIEYSRDEVFKLIDENYNYITTGSSK